MSFSAILQVFARSVNKIVAIFPQQWIQSRTSPTNLTSLLVRSFISGLLAISIVVAMLINMGFYILLFLPVTTLEWIWSCFVIVSAHQQGQHAITKIPIFIGLSFAMLVSILTYGLFFYPVVGLEKLYTALFGEKIEEGPVIGIAPQDAENSETTPRYDTTKHGLFLGHPVATKDIPFLDLGPAVDSDDDINERKLKINFALEVQDWDDGGGRKM